MISRRNIRVKVMQTLYTLDAMEAAAKPGESTRILKKHLDQCKELYVFLVQSIIETARYAETDARLKASKHLPSEADLRVNTKIAGNEVLWKMIEDSGRKAAVETFKPQLAEGFSDLIKRMYGILVESDAYQQYILEQSREKKSEKFILEYILQEILLQNEYFLDYAENQFSNWDDDAEMLQQLLLQYISKPNNGHFEELISSEKRHFAFHLLETVIDKKETNLELIRPKLKNWDADRIAVLDMILMQMGVCELLYFETIPPKVTINEYIDLAKEYSTPQSGQFVNGILDSIHKDLVTSGRLQKTNFKG